MPSLQSVNVEIGAAAHLLATHPNLHAKAAEQRRMHNQRICLTKTYVPDVYAARTCSRSEFDLPGLPSPHV